MATKRDELLSRSSDISAMLPYWDKVDAIIQGLAAMKLGGQTYLPKFPDEADNDYSYRLSMAKFTNIYRDVLEALASKPFEEPVKLLPGQEQIVSDDLLEFSKNVDGANNNITQFAALTFFNGINFAIEWIFVDYPKVDKTKVRSKADQKAAGIKPFWSHVLAKNVLEVRTQIIAAEEIITYFKLFEPKTDTVPDRVREFIRAEDGTVMWVLWEERTLTIDGVNKLDYVKIDDGILSIKYIPMVAFVTGRRDGKSFKFFPAMQDAADLQVTLYQNESALEYIKAMAGYPMLAANGMKAPMDEKGQPKKIAIGPNRVLFAPTDGKGNVPSWSFVEPNANSMEFLQKNIAQTKQDLRELGRQPLTALSTQLTTTTTAIAAGKAKSTVTFWAHALKDTLETAFYYTNLYMGMDKDQEVDVYTGFDDILDEGKDLETLNIARGRGDLSRDTYWNELKRRGVLAPEFKGDEELKKLLEEIPTEGPDNQAGDGSTTLEPSQ